MNFVTRCILTIAFALAAVALGDAAQDEPREAGPGPEQVLPLVALLLGAPPAITFAHICGRLERGGGPTESACVPSASTSWARDGAAAG